MINYILLTFGFLSSFFIVGFVFVELFFSKIIFRLKLPLYFLTSILVTTYLIYLVGVVFGFSRISVLTTFLVVLPIFLYKLIYSLGDLKEYLKFNFKAVLLSVFVFIIYLIALTPAILNLYNDYFVMSGSNWQDTAMHLSITESLTQGNFPPQAPYFSGQPLSYYYFADFHSAIIAILSNNFYPKIFTISNSILAFVLCLSLYTLSFEITKNKKISTMSSFLGTFFSSYLSIKFFNDIYSGGKISELLANKSYSMEYDKVFGMSNMADYYLQNRPMMIGIPVFVIFIALLVRGYKNKNWKYFLLSGLMVGMLIKFQFFTVLACCISFVFITLFNANKSNKLFIFKNVVLFFVTIIFFYFIFGLKSVNNQSFIELFKNNFHFGAWDLKKTVTWHISFIFLNLGLPLILTIFSFFKNKNSRIKQISLLSLLFILIPYLVCFTPAEGDMLKFFYFAVVLFSIVSVSLIYKSKILLPILIITSTLSSFLTLGNSYLNKNFGYSIDAYNAGIWIRQNTPQKSVFVTIPSVHSAPVDIGGRLRIISYINWPYSHGFNVGFDNVWTRSEDVYNVYKTGDTSIVQQRYNAKYVYLGEDELGEFPDSKIKLDLNNSLQKIYNTESISIYEIF